MGDDLYLLAPSCYRSVKDLYEFVKAHLSIRKFKKKSVYRLPDVDVNLISASQVLNTDDTQMQMNHKEDLKLEMIIDMRKNNEDSPNLARIPIQLNGQDSQGLHQWNYYLHQCPPSDSKFVPIELYQDPVIDLNSL